MNSTPELTELQTTLEAAGLRAGLEWLNKRVPHRYTVVYQFDGASFYAMEVVDNLGEAPPELFFKVPFTDSFCRYTVDMGVFKTGDSLQDQRLDGHIHQADVQSYTGLPLNDPSGNLYGTFCHLDLIPRKLEEDEFEFLQKATLLLSGHLPSSGARLYDKHSATTPLEGGTQR